jgi:2OG-Fe(II) oxygenase superfamily
MQVARQNEPISELEEWLNPKWYSLYQEQRLAEHCQSQPFKYVIMEDLLRPEKIKLLDASAQLAIVEQGAGDEEADKEYAHQGSGRSYAPLQDPPALRFFLGKNFFDFLKQITGDSLQRPLDQQPQLRSYPERSPGLKIHNDVQSPFEYGAMLYLNGRWPSDFGGCLSLWKRDKTLRKFIRFAEIEPHGNTFVMIRCGPDSWHGVDPVQGSQPRKNLFFQYKIKQKPKG